MEDVTILTSSHSTFDTRIFHKGARSLADAGYNVTLITPHSENTVRHGVKIRAVGKSDTETADIMHARQIYAEAKNIDADVYHFHDPGLIPFGVLLSYRTDGKVIYDCHEDYERAFLHYDFPPDYLNPAVARLYPSVQSLAAKRMDAVVAATDWIADDFRERGHQNVALVRNFPRKSILTSSDISVESDHKHTLVYVGNLSEDRGLFRMLNLVRELRERDRDVGLWLIGNLTGDDRRRTEAFVEEHSLENCVRPFGYIEPDNLSGHLQAADLGLCLLDRERAEYIIPTKIFEYMFSELPVVATKTTATERYLPEDCGRLVSGESREWIEAVEEILSDTALRSRMGKHGKETVETEYCWEKEEESLLSLYERL